MDITTPAALNMDLLLSLRTWPVQDSSETAVSTLISRIQQQRGHFKDINEDLLESEIAAAAASTASGESGFPSAEPTATNTVGEEIRNDQGDTSGDVTENTQANKLEMLRRVGEAKNEALIALDFVSLLVSLTSPETGLSSMSQTLRDAVPVGCLGYDRIVRKEDKFARREDAIVARAWKVEGLNSAAETLRNAADRLAADVKRETKYWEGVLAIRNDGWLITRMPLEKNVLGVRYGFAEAAQEYKDKGIGALRRNEDGSVRVDDVDTTGSHVGAMLRVRVLKNGDIVGVSTQRAAPNDVSVRDMIRRARNFVYEDELFFEIMREARTFAGQGMRTSEDAAMIEIGDNKMIKLDLVALESTDNSDTLLLPKNDLAQGISHALHILLSYNHRLTLRKRSKPPPLLTSRKPAVPPLQLLRPITTHLLHYHHLNQLVKTLSAFRRFTDSASVQHPISFSINWLKNTRSAAPIAGVESVVETFLTILETGVVLSLPGAWNLRITMRTGLQHPLYGTVYVVTTSHDGVTARLMGQNRFTSHLELEAYLSWCIERSVINEIRLMDSSEWLQEAQGNEMTYPLDMKLKIEVDAGVGLSITWGSPDRRDEKFVWDGTAKDRSLLDILKHIESLSKRNTRGISEMPPMI